MLAEAKKADAVLAIQAPENTRALASVDPALLARVARARAPVRETTLKKRWCSTLWPTEAGAQQAGTDLADFSAFVARALFLDQPDPVAAWGGLRAFQERLIGVGELRRAAVGDVPSGEVFTSPLQDSANGTIRFDVPSSPAGVEVAGVRITFRDGVVVDARAERGDAYLQQALATDEGPPPGRGGRRDQRRHHAADRRRSAGPCTSRSGAPIRRPAARTPARSTGTSSATSARGVKPGGWSAQRRWRSGPRRGRLRLDGRIPTYWARTDGIALQPGRNHPIRPRQA